MLSYSGPLIIYSSEYVCLIYYLGNIKSRWVTMHTPDFTGFNIFLLHVAISGFGKGIIFQFTTYIF